MLNKQWAADFLEGLDQFVPYERVDVLRLQFLDLSGYRNDVHADWGCRSKSRKARRGAEIPAEGVPHSEELRL